MKGILLAGGKGTRLYPLTKVISKQLLPVYDKPMVYYPLSTLMLAGIRDILIISDYHNIKQYEYLLGDGSDLGIKIEYMVQKSPDGLAQAFILGEEFIADQDVCLVLGDNIFYGDGFSEILEDMKKRTKLDKKAGVIGYYVKDPERFGVVEFDENQKVLSLEEKPENPKSNYAIVGLYFYPNDVIELAKTVKKSDRGEYEITDLNKLYFEAGRLNVEQMGRGFRWLETGTVDSLIEAGNFIQTVESNGLKIGCIEEVAYHKGFITHSELIDLGNKLSSSEYGKYLLELSDR